MTATRVQTIGSGHGGSGGFGAQAATFTGAVTAGNLLVCWYWGNSNTGNATCADNINGTWNALTQQTPVTGSGRRANWFWVITKAAAANGLTVTVTPNANAGNSEFIQIAEYSGVGAVDSVVTAFAQQSTASTSWSQASGTPSVTGDLVLYGVAFDNDTSTHTISATSGITSVYAGGGGTSGGTLAMAIGELLSASTTAVTCVMGVGTSDDGGKYVIGFRAATSPTKTQTAIARIANSRTKTQSAIARIANNLTKTQSAIARIANNRNKTQSATARIAVNRSLAQSATANIQNSLGQTKTQTAIARIANNRNKTQSAIARIAQTFTKTQSATARIILNVVRSTTQTATARIAISLPRSKTQSATARIAVNIFTPPTTDITSPIYTPDRRDVSQPVSETSQRLFRFFSMRKRGVTVLGYIDGTFVSKLNPSQDDLNAASVIYLGGHTYQVSDVQTAALVAAGYTVAVSS